MCHPTGVAEWFARFADFTLKTLFAACFDCCDYLFRLYHSQDTPGIE